MRRHFVTKFCKEIIARQSVFQPIFPITPLLNLFFFAENIPVTIFLAKEEDLL